MKYLLTKKLQITSVFLLCCCIIASCKRDDLNQEKQNDESEMLALRAEIDQLANQFNCEQAADWKFVEIGAQACGGPTGFIAYNNKIDEGSFLKKVEHYSQKQKDFNVKWKLVSPCALLLPPKSVACVSGKAKFVY